jgi:hypothetical protein
MIFSFFGDNGGSLVVVFRSFDPSLIFVLSHPLAPFSGKEVCHSLRPCTIKDRAKENAASYFIFILLNLFDLFSWEMFFCGWGYWQ